MTNKQSSNGTFKCYVTQMGGGGRVRQISLENEYTPYVYTSKYDDDFDIVSIVRFTER